MLWYNHVFIGLNWFLRWVMWPMGLLLSFKSSLYSPNVRVIVKIAELQAINVYFSKFSLFKILISQFLVFKPVFLFSFLAWKTSHLRSWWGRNSPSSRYFLLRNLTCFFFQFVESSGANNGFSKWINSYGDNYLNKTPKN